jgi:hypothetical protein
MNKLFLGYFQSFIALSLAGNFSPAPELIERARGYAHHRQAQSKIRYEDGIDRAEAFALAELEILGAVDSRRLPVQGYDLPKKDGDFWRINVFIKTSKGLENRPILVDSITGASRGKGVYVNWRDGWFNTGGGSVNLGSSHYRIERDDKIANSFRVEVTLNRITENNDLAAHQECYRDAVRAIVKIKKGFPAKFEDVPLTAIVISESELSDTYSRADRLWRATFPLTQTRSMRSHKP